MYVPHSTCCVQVAAVFRPLQVIVSSFAALNHGGNDVGNCIGPLVTIWFVYQVQTQLYKCTVCVYCGQTPLGWSTAASGELPWLLWGGIGISVGKASEQLLPPPTGNLRAGCAG